MELKQATLPFTDAESVASHIAYLARMATEGVVPAEVAAKARKVWELARAAVPGLPVPAAVAYDGGPIHYTWDNGRHQVTAEFHPADSRSDWFTTDRRTNAFDGEDFHADFTFPEPLLDGLRRILEPTEAE